MKINLLGLLFIAISSSHAFAKPIKVSGYEWQLVGMQNLSWEGVNAVCSSDGFTACTGAVKSGVEPEDVDLSGWIWATKAQVIELLINKLPGIDPPFTAATDGISEFRSQWAPAFFNWGFGSGRFNSSLEFASILSDRTPDLLMFFGVSFIDNNPMKLDGLGIRLVLSADKNSEISETGFLMMRQALKPVPIPATIWLLNVGLIALFGLAKRKK